MVTTAGVIEINNKVFMAQAMNIKIDSLLGEDSGVDDAGFEHNNWIFTKKFVLNINMAPMLDVSELLGLVQGKEYKIKFYNPLTNSVIEKEVYTKSVSVEIVNGAKPAIDDNQNHNYFKVSFTATEKGGIY